MAGGRGAADADRFGAAVLHSLDRKVCNTLNVCCIPAAPPTSRVFLAAFDEAAARRGTARLHVLGGARGPASDSVP